MKWDQEEVIDEMARKHDISHDRARRIVLGYEPEPGTFWDAQERLRNRWAEFKAEVLKVFGGRS